MLRLITGQGSHIGFLIGKRNNILEKGIAFLLPVKFYRILLSNYREEFENAKS